MNQFTFDDIWTGRIDTEDGELGLRWHQKINLKKIDQLTKVNQKTIGILGFCSDEGVKRNKGRVGAKNAPNVIRKACANLPFNNHKNNTLIDVGNIICENGNLEIARNEQIKSVSTLIKNNYFPLILGGGHETALGNFLALSKHYKSIAIINIDAHFDLRKPITQSTSGTPFYEMSEYCKKHFLDFNYCCVGVQESSNTQALFKQANDLNVNTILADEVHTNLSQTLKNITHFIAQAEVIYLSLDLDALDASFAPGVSAPCVNGLFPQQVKKIIHILKNTGKLALFDIVELNPNYDIDNRTAKLAAHFIHQIGQEIN